MVVKDARIFYVQVKSRSTRDGLNAASRGLSISYFLYLKNPLDLIVLIDNNK